MYDPNIILTIIGIVVTILSIFLIPVIVYFIRHFLLNKQIGIIIPKKMLRNQKLMNKLLGFIPGWKKGYVSFENREQNLMEALEEKKNVRIIEEAGRGKTRTIIESIKKLASVNKEFRKTRLYYLYFGSKFSYKYVFLFKRFLLFKHPLVILFFDDIDKIIPIVKNSGMNIRTIIHDFEKFSKIVIVICTCRKETWVLSERKLNEMKDFLETKDDLDILFEKRIHIRKLDEEEWLKLATELKLDVPEYFTGNPSDIVLGTIAKKSEYTLLSEQHKKIMHAIKICKTGNLDDLNVKIVGNYVLKHFKIFDWQILIDELRKAEFFTIDSNKIYIPEVYLTNVISDYPPSLNPILNKDLIALIDVLIDEKASKELSRLAFKFKELNLLRQSLKCLNSAIEFEPKNPFYYNNRGLVYSLLGKFEKAIDDFNKSLALKANLAETRFNLGNVYSKFGKYEEASLEYQKALEKNPNLIDAFNNLGIVYTYLNDFESALKCYNNAISLNKSYINSFYNRAKLQNKNKNYNKAINDYSKVIKLDGSLKDPYYYRGLANLQIKNYDKAIKDFNYLIKLDKRYIYAYLYRGIAFNLLKNYNKAIQDLSTTIEMDNSTEKAYLYRAMSYYKANQLDNAISDCNFLIQMKPKNAVNYIRRGWYYYISGDYERSLEDHLIASEIDPKNALAFLNISIVFYALDDRDKVELYLDKATKINYKILFKSLEEDYLDNRFIPRELVDIFMSYLARYEKRFTLKEKRIVQKIRDSEAEESNTK